MTLKVDQDTPWDKSRYAMEKSDSNKRNQTYEINQDTLTVDRDIMRCFLNSNTPYNLKPTKPSACNKKIIHFPTNKE